VYWREQVACLGMDEAVSYFVARRAIRLPAMKKLWVGTPPIIANAADISLSPSRYGSATTSRKEPLNSGCLRR
jgi:hypothetical protein